MRKYISLIAILIALQGMAQNVGIGTSTPFDKLHIHSGASSVVGLGISNNFSDANGAVRLGLVYVNGNTNFQYGYLQMQEKLPFVIRQNYNGVGHNRLIIDSVGQIGLGSNSLDGFRLAVSGPTVIFPGVNQPAYLLVADTIANSKQPAGLAIQKKSNSGQNFTILSHDESRALAVLQSDFKNGSANSRSVRIQMDSTGNVGIGDVTSATMPLVRSNLHVFGNQRIEGMGNIGARLDLHSKADNYTNGSSIRLYYSPFGYLSQPPAVGPSILSHYFIKLNDANAATNKAKTLAMGIYTGPFGPAVESEDVGMVYNTSRQVGIRKYPNMAESSTVKVDIEGDTRINGSLTLNESGVDALSALIFRNGGGYRGGLGWDEAAGRFFFYDGESNTNTFFINNGRMGIQRNPTTNDFEVNGNASKSSAGSWLANSDVRLKKDIQPISSALQKIQQLQGITYQWNDDKTGIKRPSGIQMGFTAQNIQAVFPQEVSTDALGYLQTAYGTYDALMVEAIKELVEKIETLEQKVKMLENK